MKGMAVTRRQKEVLDFISGFVERNGYSPSFEEIAKGLDLKSLATVHKHITNLQNKAHCSAGTTAAARSTCCPRGAGRARPSGYH